MATDTVSSYAVGADKAGRMTFVEMERIYRYAVSFVIGVYDLEWLACRPSA